MIYIILLVLVLKTALTNTMGMLISNAGEQICVPCTIMNAPYLGTDPGRCGLCTRQCLLLFLDHLHSHGFRRGEIVLPSLMLLDICSLSPSLPLVTEFSDPLGTTCLWLYLSRPSSHFPSGLCTLPYLTFVRYLIFK